MTDPKYVVALDISRATSEDEQSGGGKLLGMKDKHGRKFNCQIPDLSSTDHQASGNADSLVSQLLTTLCMVSILMHGDASAHTSHCQNFW